MNDWLIWLIRLIAGAFIIGLLSLVILFFKKNLRLKPLLEIKLEKNYPWTNFPDSRREEIHLKQENITPDKKTNILSMKAPDESHYKRYNIEWRAWFWSWDDFSKIMLLTDKTQEKLAYELARKNKKNVGPWTLGDIPSENVWFIFYFKDDYWKKERCYCKRYRFNPRDIYPWRKERDQIRNKLNGRKLREKNECKECTFKTKWEKGDLWKLVSQNYKKLNEEPLEANSDEIMCFWCGTLLEVGMKKCPLCGTEVDGNANEDLSMNLTIDLWKKTEAQRKKRDKELKEELDKKPEGELTDEKESEPKPVLETLYDKKKINIPSPIGKTLGPIKFNKGDILEGIVFEIYKQNLNFYIFSKPEYIKFYKDREGESIFEFEDEFTETINVIIPNDNEYYIVFDTYSLRNDREVEFTLKFLHKN